MSDVKIHIEGTCPEEFAVCMTDEEWYEFVNAYELDILDEASDLPQISDAEAVANFTWEILFLSPWELAYIALPMSVLAFYGLSIYAIFKWLQKKFS
tara:strand:+ start:2583 stop:2873 length:291 start_codon:yes stop_codon:yes gene_type:complete